MQSADAYRVFTFNKNVKFGTEFALTGLNSYFYN